MIPYIPKMPVPLLVLNWSHPYMQGSGSLFRVPGTWYRNVADDEGGDNSICFARSSATSLPVPGLSTSARHLVPLVPEVQAPDYSA